MHRHGSDLSRCRPKTCPRLPNGSVAINTHVTCSGTFHYWYRYVRGLNLQIPSKLRLFQDDTDDDKYVFDYRHPCKNINGSTVCALNADNTAMPTADPFFGPLINNGYASTESATGNTHTYGNFTSELHTYFQYKSAATLEFIGDDDVWAFINNKLFVDLGGMRDESDKSSNIKADTCTFKNVHLKTKTTKTSNSSATGISICMKTACTICTYSRQNAAIPVQTTSSRSTAS